MSIANYSELQSAVEAWLDSSAHTSRVPDFITLGENRVYRELRIRTMETALSVSVSGGVAAMPSDYVELKHAAISGSPNQPLLKQTAEWVFRNYPTRSADSKPKYIAEDGDNFIFGPYPDTTYTLVGTYYARLAALSATNTTNWFITNAPDILLAASLVEAWEYIGNDKERDYWEIRYQNAKRMIQKEDNKRKISGSPLMTVAN